MIEKIINYIIKEGIENTISGQWNIFVEDIESVFNIPYDYIYSIKEDIKDKLDTRKEILSETWDLFDDNKWIGFDCNFCGVYCPNWEENGEFE